MRLSLARWLLVPAVFLGGLLGCAGESDELLVFAATSLTDSLAEIGPAFERESGARVAVSFGGSQLLAQQIVKGAPADVFIAAGVFPMDLLAREGLLSSAPEPILRNELVLVTRPDLVPESLQVLLEPGVERVAVADPDLAPAGRYAQESLKSLGLWDDISEKLIKGSDVRSTLTYVERGNADAALVYRTDAASADGVEIYDIVPPDSHSPIVYPAAIIERSERQALAARFLAYLTGVTAQEIFRSHGFEPVGP